MNVSAPEVSPPPFSSVDRQTSLLLELRSLNSERNTHGSDALASSQHTSATSNTTISSSSLLLPVVVGKGLSLKVGSALNAAAVSSRRLMQKSHDDGPENSTPTKSSSAHLQKLSPPSFLGGAGGTSSHNAQQHSSQQHKPQELSNKITENVHTLFATLPTPKLHLTPPTIKMPTIFSTQKSSQQKNALVEALKEEEEEESGKTVTCMDESSQDCVALDASHGSQHHSPKKARVRCRERRQKARTTKHSPRERQQKGGDQHEGRHHTGTITDRSSHQGEKEPKACPRGGHTPHHRLDESATTKSPRKRIHRVETEKLGEVFVWSLVTDHTSTHNCKEEASGDLQLVQEKAGDDNGNDQDRDDTQKACSKKSKKHGFVQHNDTKRHHHDGLQQKNKTKRPSSSSTSLTDALTLDNADSSMTLPVFKPEEEAPEPSAVELSQSDRHGGQDLEQSSSSQKAHSDIILCGGRRIGKKQNETSIDPTLNTTNLKVSEQNNTFEKTSPKAAAVEDDDDSLDWKNLAAKEEQSEVPLHRRSSAERMKAVETSDVTMEAMMSSKDVVVFSRGVERHVSGLSADMDPSATDRGGRKHGHEDGRKTLKYKLLLEKPVEDCQPSKTTEGERSSGSDSRRGRSKSTQGRHKNHDNSKLNDTSKRSEADPSSSPQEHSSHTRRDSPLPEVHRRSKSHNKREARGKRKHQRRSASTSQRDLNQRTRKQGDSSIDLKPRERSSRSHALAHMTDHSHYDEDKRKIQHENRHHRRSSHQSASQANDRDCSKNMSKSNRMCQSSHGHHGSRRHSSRKRERLHHSERQLNCEDSKNQWAGNLDGLDKSKAITNVKKNENSHRPKASESNNAMEVVNSEPKHEPLMNDCRASGLVSENGEGNHGTREHRTKPTSKKSATDRLHKSEGILAYHHDRRDRRSFSKRVESSHLDSSSRSFSGSKKVSLGEERNVKDTRGRSSSRRNKHHKSESARTSKNKSGSDRSLQLERREKDRSSHKIRGTSFRGSEHQERGHTREWNASKSRLVEAEARSHHHDLRSNPGGDALNYSRRTSENGRDRKGGHEDPQSRKTGRKGRRESHGSTGPLQNSIQGNRLPISIPSDGLGS